MLCKHNLTAVTKLYLPDKDLGYCAASLIPCLNKTILIASLYNPPTDSSYCLPTSEVIELMKLLHSLYYYVILVGGLNLQTDTYLSFCKTDYLMLNNLLEQDAIYSIFWSNVSVVVSNWYEWLWPKIRACTRRMTKHRETMPRGFLLKHLTCCRD